MRDGVSVIVCCHNSAGRLVPTLEHLKQQCVPKELAWEVLVVDNASTDDTAEVARKAWGNCEAAPLRVVREARLGKMNGFRLGCAEASFEILAFLDDDNWVSPDWVGIAHGVMMEHRDFGVCGGFIEPVFEVPPPGWFHGIKEGYAIGSQGEKEANETQDVTSTQKFLWGAGMILRRSGWAELVEKGFRSRLTCRKGKEMSSGGDSEVCIAMRMAGWKLAYEPRLRLKHFIPASRLTWSHARKLFRGFGDSWAVFEAYRIADELAKNPADTRIGKRLWLHPMRRCLQRLNSMKRALVRAFSPGTPEGLRLTLDVETQIGFLHGLLKRRGAFGKMVEELRDAGWRKRPPILPDH